MNQEFPICLIPGLGVNLPYREYEDANTCPPYYKHSSFTWGVGRVQMCHYIT